ncbi:uncharacterized protein BDZ99DRAFT_465565 [Mytilinidion resinicola]|uniref:Uncharacterized protein n=1 Tax=Mytilinidion resinicola TaxID=574789 RepID=A0A6A6YDU5_9PEZI|nr:uncharacterized protein BDZ99DRAFT_465565 [Mytilinidion resinicola]KAF2806769.1 hypothetical protein BDZ99DRAFT_465565 [Mytilinidion resinicola]
MPAVTIPSPTPDETPARDDGYDDYYNSGESSPRRPPVSPLTPVATLAQLATVPADADGEERVLPPQPATFMKQPAPVPISESENPDVIAMRSAISLLQLQREKSKRDLVTLEKLKTAAVAEPEAFVRELRAGRLQSANPASNILAPTLADPDTGGMSNGTGGRHETRKDSADTLPPELKSKFAPVPAPQNIFRTPPVNWAKYHIVGESLDKLHEEQRQRPSSGEPSRDQRAPLHVIAAPYSPFTDRVGEIHPMQTRRGSKKPSP